VPYADIETCRRPKRRFSRAPGIFGETVGVIGPGKIGARLRTLLADCPIKVIANDPFLTPERATEMGVESVTLREVFKRR